jgi:hypothetical protein
MVANRTRIGILLGETDPAFVPKASVRENGLLHRTIPPVAACAALRRFSMSIYYSPLQKPDISREDRDEINEAVTCMCNDIGRYVRIRAHGPGAG